MNSKLLPGAETAIKQCLNIQNSDKLLIITDNETYEVGSALLETAKKYSQTVLMIKIEDFTSRPVQELTYDFEQTIRSFSPTASIYAAQGHQGELHVFRTPLIRLLTKELGCRHAHMIGITQELMLDGMSKDFNLMAQITDRVYNKVTAAEEITAQDEFGTNITFTLDPQNLKWVKDNGIIGKGEMHNLPAGELFTVPYTADGSVVAWELGDWMCKEYDELNSPIKIEIADGMITSATPMNTGDTKSTEASGVFMNYVSQFDNGKRVGELGLGTLVGLNKFVGNLLQDEKFPGLHVAFGHPFAEETGADWDCPSHIDVITKRATITIVKSDGTKETIMKSGIYSDEILKG
ncbi:hypothetical protein A2415_03080 [candidate division WWE3 bacterium RIFOXYC1_FULL_39_7]|uniref:Leucyl aminopeptidase n=2 Tax=Katanobacteria TaxID=422282 RepID=A0A1F4X8L4_UNCKA|nr:MAG: hypothetical protein A2415_03080 [candidate division WWE3 bacterium RIFOXYC1_FULL_39_7]OGC78014.1 MAG: hypothetical protein A2619_02930 [candidate division WWE3 bacterium RIFOXYD1_FULL_39_9]